MKTKNNKNNEENSNKKRNIILIIIAIIIIILALLTSCSCTSKFWGRIGDLFRNSKTYIYHGKDGDACEGSFYCETIRNKNLTFDNDKTNILVTDRDYKLTFSYYGINPEKYTCFTSDPSIATCYVNESGFVVLNPKKEGTVSVTLQTQIGDKIYEATTTVTIGKSNNGIILQQYKGTINLFYGNTKSVIYHLININGKININVGDPSIASATANNGILKITAKKPGNTTITLSVESDGKVYEVTYDLTVINKDTSTVDPSNPSDPTNPDNPNIPSKDSNATLNSLTTNKGTLTPEFNSNYHDYYINLTDTYDITLKATSSSDKASIIYSYNGISNTTGYFDNLKVGPNIITVTVTAEDGTINIYNVTVNVSKTDIKDDSKLLDLSTNRGELSPTFNSDTYSYTINLTDVYDILLNAKASGGAKISFEYKDIVCNTNYIGSCNFTNLNEGSNLITVTVTNKDGSTSTYTVNVIVSKTPINPPVVEKSKLSSLSANEGALTPTFDPNTNNYKVTLSDKDNSVTINAGTNNPTDKIVFEYKGKKCETGNIGSCTFDNLIDGDNDITVTVIDKNGNSNTYHVNVYKPFKYELSFSDNPFTCRYEDKMCPITYTLKINGQEVDISKYNINFSISNNYNGTYNVNGTSGYLLIPNTSNRDNINNNISVSINTTYNGVELKDTATVKFTADPYFINLFSDSYDAYVGETRPIAVNTNLFKNDTDEAKNTILNNATKDSVESLTLTSIHDGNLNLTIETSDNVESFKLTGNSGLSSLGLLVKIKDNVEGGYATVKITGYAYGEKIYTEVKIKIYKKHYVTLDATGILLNNGEIEQIPTGKKGFFNELISIQDNIPISNKIGEDTIDLVKYGIPYLVTDNDQCKVYKFLGYANINEPSKIIYRYDSDTETFDKNIKYDDISDDTTFIAVYDKNAEPGNKPPKNEYIWAVDLPLFHNEEYYNKYGVDKIIYPGAHGQYTMYIGNDTETAIKLVGMVLEEDTICIGEGKCLNMSYYIKAGTPTDTGANYPTLYSGNLENNYQILHEDPTATRYDYLGNHNGGKTGIDPNYHNTYRKDLNLENNKDNLVIKAGTTEADKNGLAITIHWEWVFSVDADEDKVDTAIGNYAAQTGDNLNDMYSLKVGLKLEIPDDGCNP